MPAITGNEIHFESRRVEYRTLIAPYDAVMLPNGGIVTRLVSPRANGGNMVSPPFEPASVPPGASHYERIVATAVKGPAGTFRGFKRDELEAIAETVWPTPW